MVILLTKSFLFGVSSFPEDYSAMYSQTPDIDPNGTPLSSPRGVNANNIDVASPLVDDVDDDDQFSKRRLVGLTQLL